MHDPNYLGESADETFRALQTDLRDYAECFLYLRKEYSLLAGSRESRLLSIQRLDPTRVGIVIDHRGVPGVRYHFCVLHRDNLLEVPQDQAEVWSKSWGGKCANCGEATEPVYFSYNHPLSGIAYLLKEEVVHFAPLFSRNLETRNV